MLTPPRSHSEVAGPSPAWMLAGSRAIVIGAGALPIMRVLSDPPHPLTVIAVCAGVAVAAIALARRPDRQVQLAIALVSLMASLWMVELVLSVALPSSARGRIAAQHGITYDRRSALEVVRSLRQRGITAVGNLRPWPPRGDASLAPLGGAPDRLTILCNESGAFVSYRSDAHGFNNPPELRSGPVDLALLGDSFVHGVCVPPEHTIAGYLRETYPGTLNLGYVGNGPLTTLAIFREYVEPLQPPVVLWFHYEANDLTDLDAEARAGWLLSYLRPSFSQSLRQRGADLEARYRQIIDQSPLDADDVSARHGRPWGALTLDALERRFGLDSPVVDTIQHVKLSELRMKLVDMRDQIRRKAAQRAAALPENDPLFAQVLALAGETTASWHGQFMVVYLPSWYRYAKSPPPELHRSRVLATCERLGLRVIDLHPVFDAQPDPLALFPFGIDGHYTADGYRLVAETILAGLREAR